MSSTRDSVRPLLSEKKSDSVDNTDCGNGKQYANTPIPAKCSKEPTGTKFATRSYSNPATPSGSKVTSPENRKIFELEDDLDESSSSAATKKISGNCGDISTDTLENMGMYFHRRRFPSIESSHRSGHPLIKKIRRTWKLLRLLVEDWLFLALLGVLMALCSLAMDVTIEKLQTLHVMAYEWAKELESDEHMAFTYTVWMSYAVILTLASALFAHYVAPQAIGSGIPEMKTILRGVILKEYLSVRTLISKMVGLTLSLGSGLPIGKEGPFVHVASVVANQLSKFVGNVNNAFSNESRSHEMLAAGCAVGVACTFSAPIGGVLFSIEVTSVYFAVRNYWRGFFAALVAATTFRVSRVLLTASEEGLTTGVLPPTSHRVTVVAFYQTRFPKEAFFPEELPVFAIIGLICGLSGAVFIKFHRELVLFLRKNQLMIQLIQKNWVAYPAVVAFLVSTITYPKGFGQFLSGEHKFSQTLKMFLSNCTWTADLSHHNACPRDFLDEWTGSGENNILIALTLFTLTFFVLAVVSSTMPIPAGIFMPVFIIGASFGRLVGELMATLYPNGIRDGEQLEIYPGIYAVVGAAAFCGAVTHTVSVAVIVFELTGQLMHILPVMIAVVIANAACSYLQPSIYDSIIQMKHLPYLPDLSHSSSIFHNIKAEQIMVYNVKYLWKSITYAEIRNLLERFPKLRAFPIVEEKRSRILLGSVSRVKLLELIDKRIGIAPRQAEASRRMCESFQRQSSRPRLSLNEPDVMKKSFGVDDPLLRFSVVQLPMTLNRRKSATPKRTRRFRCFRKQNTEDSETERSILNTADRERAFSGPISTVHSIESSLGDIFRRSLSRISFGRITKRETNGMVYDLYGDDRILWEKSRLAEKMELDEIAIDPAPFQLVEHTSLFKVHSLFSLLGLNRAYVTKVGRLIGVVSLREVRIAIERAQVGALCPGGPPLVEESEVIDDQTDSDSDYEDALQPRLEVVRPTSVYANQLLDENTPNGSSNSRIGSPRLARLLSLRNKSPNRSVTRNEQTNLRIRNKTPVNLPLISVTQVDEDAGADRKSSTTEERCSNLSTQM